MSILMYSEAILMAECDSGWNTSDHAGENRPVSNSMLGKNGYLVLQMYGKM